MNQQFNDLNLTVHETYDSRQWYMTVEEVAAGYGVVEGTIRKHLHDHRDGIERGVTISDTLGGSQQVTILYLEDLKSGSFIG